jgi:uncharacterized protein
MADAFEPLSDAELQEFNRFLLYEVDSDDSMVIETFDGYLHAIAIGPSTLHPKQWLPKVWGMDTMLPPMKSMDQLNSVLSLIMRHFNSIISGFESDPREFIPYWETVTHRGREYVDAEMWAHGFVTGMQLSWEDWKPMLDTPEGQAWYRPIGLLGQVEFCPDQLELIKTPAKRNKLANQISDAVMAIHAYWMPLRIAVHERTVAKAMQPKVGRNETCPCGSGKKFKKCCGGPTNLH